MAKFGRGGRDTGFDDAFRELFPIAYRVTYRILGNVTEAEDAAAEALARALVRWPKVGELTYRDAWVLRVATNVALDVARRRRRSRSVIPDPVSDPGEATVLRLALGEALARLPRRQRETVSLRHLAGLSEAEIALALGISENSVKTHTSRGMAALRARIGPEWREESVAF